MSEEPPLCSSLDDTGICSQCRLSYDIGETDLSFENKNCDPTGEEPCQQLSPQTNTYFCQECCSDKANTKLFVITNTCPISCFTGDDKCLFGPKKPWFTPEFEKEYPAGKCMFTADGDDPNVSYWYNNPNKPNNPINPDYVEEFGEGWIPCDPTCDIVENDIPTTREDRVSHCGQTSELLNSLEDGGNFVPFLCNSKKGWISDREIGDMANRCLSEGYPGIPKSSMCSYKDPENPDKAYLSCCVSPSKKWGYIAAMFVGGMLILWIILVCILAPPKFKLKKSVKK